MRRLFWIALGVLPLVLLSSCTRKPSAVEQGTRDGVLHLGNTSEPSDLDPQIITGVPEMRIAQALMEGLVQYDPKDLHPIPGVAEKWEISSDRRTYTFHIRADAKWSNGDPLTAQDFAYSWQRFLSPGLAAEYAYMLFYIDGAKDFNSGKLKDFAKVGVKARDDRTLVVTLANPTPFFLAVLQNPCTFPVHRATIEKHGKMDSRGTAWTRPENFVGNGPFKLKQWDLNRQIVVVKNPNYWDARTVRLNAIHFYPTDDQGTEEKLFRNGSIHKTSEVPVQKIAVYKKENPELLHNDPYLGTFFLLLNVNKKPLEDIRVRKALALAIDRQAIVETVTKGGEFPAYSLVPPSTGGYTSRSKLAFQPEEARRLLAEAGYPAGKGFPMTELTYNTHGSMKLLSEAIQQMWKKELGIEVQLSNQEWKVFLDTLRTKSFQIARGRWIGDYLDPNTFLDLFVTGGGNNDAGWSNRAYDALIAQAATTADPGARLDAFQKAEQLLLSEVPIIPVFTYSRVYLSSPDVHGWYPNILDEHPYKFVWLEKASQ
jgi:oligopeptide transport system substrate-binding protein